MSNMNDNGYELSPEMNIIITELETEIEDLKDIIKGLEHELDKIRNKKSEVLPSKNGK